ncbi:MAG: universal stress protein, partial [Blastocatellia bacterium]
MNRFTVLVPRKDEDEPVSSILMSKQIARQIGATPVIFHVTAKHKPAHQLQDLLGLSDDSVSGCILETIRGDDVASAIVKRAQDPAVRFVVLSGSRNRPEMGPITARVLASGCSPTIVLKPEVGRAADDTSDAIHDVPQENSIRRILVPLDSSPAAAEAIRPALELAAIENAQIDILHIAGYGSAAELQMGALPLGRYVDQPHHELITWSSEFLNRFYHSV